MIQQRQVNSLPPHWEEIQRAFPAVTIQTIFSYGDIVYVPSGVRLPKPLIVHEAIHGSRQVEIGVEVWWSRYLADRKFCFEEELVAHRAEWKAFVNGVPYPGRHAKDRMLAFIARKLSGPLYGEMVSFEIAKGILQ